MDTRSKEELSNLDKNFRSKIDSYYDTLVEEAPGIQGDVCEIIHPKDIPWLQPELLKANKQYVRGNFLGVVLTTVFALCLLFSAKPVALVLLKTRRFLKPDDSFARLRGTIDNIQGWGSVDIFSEEFDEKFKTFETVRRLHAAGAKSRKTFPTEEEMGASSWKEELIRVIKADLDFIDTNDAPEHLLTWDPQLVFSQWDMALTQFAFIGYAYFYRNLFDMSGDGHKGFMHQWAVNGRVLGMEDRFNLALHPDPELFRKLLINTVVYGMKTADLGVITLQDALFSGIGKRVPFFTTKSVFYLGFRRILPGFEGKNLYASMNFYEKISCYFAHAFLFTFSLKLFKVPFNYLLFFLIERTKSKTASHM